MRDMTPEGEPAHGGKAYRFRMDKPVAPYLIALAVGDIAFQSLGDRTGVYAEPSTLKAAAEELVDTEKMVQAAEKASSVRGSFQRSASSKSPSSQAHAAAVV